VLFRSGDNQSIDNELSTYTYRLKRINHFIQIATNQSLFLLDEFGSGSDPDLGGAIAEVFFESLYENTKSSAIQGQNSVQYWIYDHKMKPMFFEVDIELVCIMVICLGGCAVIGHLALYAEQGNPMVDLC
jgi:hypothetical protein